MSKQEYLRPHDVCVLLQLAIQPKTTFRELARAVGLSLGEAHNAAQRLQMARLVLLDEPSVNIPGAMDFLTAGVPYAFPAQVGAATRGIPTAFLSPAMVREGASDERLVWPSPKGPIRGLSLTPLSPGVADVWETNKPLYHLLTAVDALRVGRARERDLARAYLEKSLRSRHASWTD